MDDLLRFYTSKQTAPECYIYIFIHLNMTFRYKTNIFLDNFKSIFKTLDSAFRK